jgi:putative ABC transport system permease protein
VKYLPLIWAGLWRKPTRTAFTFLSILFAFVLVGLLQGVNAAFSTGVEASNVNRLQVQNKINFTESLPIAQLEQIKAVPGVARVTYATWFGAYYQDPKNFLFSFPVDAASYFDVYREFKLPKDQLEALQRTRTGAVVDATTAQKYGWKIGDRIPLHSTIWTRKVDGSSDWTFDLVGIVDDSEVTGFGGGFIFNHDYFDEGRAFGKGTVGWYVVTIADPIRAAAISNAIDTLFQNSSDETKTVTEKEAAQSFLKQQGDINLIVIEIMGAVFFTLLFLTWNSMTQSVRERIPEFAVLKTLGYSDSGVMALILAESLTLCVSAAALGLAAAWVCYPMLGDFIGVPKLPPSVLGFGIGAAIVLALATGVPPAWRVRRLKIVDALAGR